MTDKEVLKIREDFAWFKHNNHLTYLDSSATSLKPIQVLDAMNYYYNFLCTNPHNNDSVFAYKTADLIAKSRKTLAQLLNVKQVEIIFTPGATYSLNLAANAIKDFVGENDEVVITYAEHTSNLLPWQNICHEKKAKLIFAGSEFFINENDIISKVNKKTKVISFANASNVLAYNLDYLKIAIEAKKINPDVIIVVDATQAVPHQKHDLSSGLIDFLAFSGHKMLGPTGIGVCYINHKWEEKIRPLVYGGGMNAIVEPNRYTYAILPDKFEAGTANVAGIIGLARAVEYLNDLGWDKIEQHERELKDYLDEQLSQIPNLEYYNKKAKLPIVFFNMKGVSSQDFASYLGSHDIIVRAGLSCAKLSYKITKVNGAVRASFYLYNTKSDIDKLVKILKSYKKGDELTHVII